MPRLDAIDLEIDTSDIGRQGPVSITINGHDLPLEHVGGGTAPGETLRGTASPRSFVHSLTLTGPDEGSWALSEVRLTYRCSGVDPYEVKLGAVVLDSETDLNIWHEAEPEVIDV